MLPSAPWVGLVQTMIFVDRTHDDVHDAPSCDVSIDDEELEHGVAAIGSGAEELHRMRDLHMNLTENIDGAPSHGATRELAD